MVERNFQAKLVKELEYLFPDAIIMVNDGNYLQGFPDITIFCGDTWATLECKKSALEPHRPNQDYYVNAMNRMSYSAFVYPENKEEVIRDLQQTFGARR